MEKRYTFSDDEADVVTQKIEAIVPVSSNAWVVYVGEGKAAARTQVVAWAIMSDGSAEPVTISGVWDGTEQDNRFILFADGHCEAYGEWWPNIEAAIAGTPE